jgi:hypothetical protein
MIFSSYPYWWLALPLLLLPWWWHRQKRQRLTAEPLATARFLPAAEPQQLRIWQWRDRLLLLVRCLLLIALLAWLAAIIVPWRGDTVLLDKGADRCGRSSRLPPLAWATHSSWNCLPSLCAGWPNMSASGAPPPVCWWSAAISNWPCPHGRPVCPCGDAAYHGWHCSGDQALLPGLAMQEVVLATTPERLPLWRAMFAAFASVGADQAKGGPAVRFVDTPGPATSLIIWDRPDAVPVQWAAPRWWLGTARVRSEQAAGQSVSLHGLRLQYADTAQGRTWTSDAFPPRDADAAHALYQSWQQLQPAAAAPYGLTSQQWSATPASGSRAAEAEPARWLAYVLLALLMIERVLSHARRN